MPGRKDMLGDFLSHLHGRRQEWGVCREGDRALAVEHPFALAALASFLKQRAQQRERESCRSTSNVFWRGEDQPHPGLRASLVRASDGERVVELSRAQRELEKRLTKRLGSQMGRFRQRDLSALLQHYGVKTTWVDVVDNLFVAVWFALHCRKEVGGTDSYVPSGEPFGWIRFVDTAPSGCQPLKVKDLRATFLQYSLRPHVQHGLSVSLDGVLGDGASFDDYVVATVRIPNDRHRWSPGGFWFTDRFLFPPPADDHTLGVLTKHNVNGMIDEVTDECGLRRGDVGCIRPVRYRESSTPVEGESRDGQ